MNFIDFFAGLGGFRLGLEQSGHRCVGWCEIDKFAQKSYRAIHNTEGEWFADDITKVDYRDMPRADIWTFGFPCQDISVAGKQAGFSGKRSSLFFAVTKLLRQTKEWDSERMPTYLLIENVKNFLSINNGWDFLLAQAELDEIGYDTEWQLLNSKDYGVPQNRERVFIVGHLRNRSTRKVFPIPTGNGETLKQVNIGNVNPSGNGMNGNVWDSRGLAPTLTTNKGEGNKILKNMKPIDIAMTLTAAGPSRGRGNNNPVNGVLETYRIKDDTKKGYTEFIPTEETTIDLSVPSSTTRRGRVKDGVTPTLDTGCQVGIFTDYRIRKLTPRECFRLQGFPDWAFDKAAEVNSDSQLYKQAGNSVTVNVIHEIVRRLM